MDDFPNNIKKTPYWTALQREYVVVYNWKSPNKKMFKNNNNPQGFPICDLQVRKHGTCLKCIFMQL